MIDYLKTKEVLKVFLKTAIDVADNGHQHITPANEITTSTREAIAINLTKLSN